MKDYRLDMLKSLVNIRDTFKDISDVDLLNISRTIGYLLEDLRLDNVKLYRKAKELGL